MTAQSSRRTIRQVTRWLLLSAMPLAIARLAAQVTSGPPSNLRFSDAVDIRENRSREDRIVEQITSARQEIRQRPDSPRSYLALGLALKAMGENEGAEKALEKALALDAGLADAWCAKGAILAGQQKW